LPQQLYRPPRFRQSGARPTIRKPFATRADLFARPWERQQKREDLVYSLLRTFDTFANIPKL
jgi:hypothetical protein